MSQSVGTARVTIPPDDDGMIGCQCPQETCRPRYFKIESAPALGDDAADTGAETEQAKAQEAPEEIEGAHPSFTLEWQDTSVGDDSDLGEDESQAEYAVAAQEEAPVSNEEQELHCPYCGQAADRQQFFTPEQ